MIKRIVHFNVVCSDIEKSLEFYCDLLGGHLLGNREREIIINRKSETNLPGIFAAGDVADAPFKQAITGVAEGVVAAYSAFDYIKGVNIEY